MKTAQAHNALLVGYAEPLKPTSISQKRRLKIQHGEAEPMKTIQKMLEAMNCPDCNKKLIHFENNKRETFWYCKVCSEFVHRRDGRLMIDKKVEIEKVPKGKHGKKNTLQRV